MGTLKFSFWVVVPEFFVISPSTCAPGFRTILPVIPPPIAMPLWLTLIVSPCTTDGLLLLQLAALAGLDMLGPATNSAINGKVMEIAISNRSLGRFLKAAGIFMQTETPHWQWLIPY